MRATGRFVSHRLVSATLHVRKTLPGRRPGLTPVVLCSVPRPLLRGRACCQHGSQPTTDAAALACFDTPAMKYTSSRSPRLRQLRHEHTPCQKRQIETPRRGDPTSIAQRKRVTPGHQTGDCRRELQQQAATYTEACFLRSLVVICSSHAPL